MEGKVALVTGASAGIGEGIALSLVRRGCKRLALVARRRERLEEVAGRCRAEGAGEALVVAKDLSVDQQCAEAVQETVKHFGSE